MTDTTSPVDFQVRRDALGECRFAPAPAADAIPLQDGEVLLAVEAFGLTSNNITLAAFGEALSYWDFFPAPDGWGRIPVWGFAQVERSQHPDIRPGDRVYGYLPMSTHLIVRPAHVTDEGFSDDTPHRRALVEHPALAPLYNEYQRMPATAQRSPDDEAAQMLLSPLFGSAFVLDDHYAANDFFGAEAIVISSASSRTAYATAMLLARRRAVDVIGLTSPSNIEGVRSLGCYDHVFSYDQIEDLPGHAPTAYLDLSGSAATRRRIHLHLGDHLEHDLLLGATHRDALGDSSDIAGPPPVMFFAVVEIDARQRAWGRDVYAQRLEVAWDYLLDQVNSRQLMTPVRGNGPQAVEAVYRAMLTGPADPRVGHVLSLQC